EELWGARCYELYGIAEIGPTNPGCPSQEGNHLCEDWYHALVVDESGNPVPYGEVGEHIVTSYIQDGQPLIKYRTHDLVRWTDRACGCGTTWLYYPGGVLGLDAAGVLEAVSGVSIDVAVQAPRSLPRYELKAKRFFDHRPAGHRWQLAGRDQT